MSAAAVTACVERRRSTRVPIRLAVIVCEHAGRFQEETCITSVNTYGILVALAAPVTRRSEAL